MNNNNFLSKIWNAKRTKNEQSSHSKNNEPSFKPLLFTNLSKLSSAQKSSPPSSFYAGKVQYGGAMSANRSATASPYVVPKVKKHSKRKDQSEKSAGGSLSSTARKILQTLEKMSTPLQDIKKIPPPHVKVSNLFGKQQRNKRPLGSSFFESGKRVCPPRSGRSAFSHTVNSSASIPLDNSLVTRSLVEKISAAESKSETGSSTSHPVYKGVPGVLASMSSSSGMKFKSSSNVGKMRNPRKGYGHYSAAANDEEMEQPNLPDVSFNISTLPAFNFNKPESTSTPAPTKPSSLEKGESLESKYTFSAPLPSTKRRKANTSASKLNFNSPLNSPQQIKPRKESLLKQNNPSPLSFSSKKNTLNTEDNVLDILENKITDKGTKAVQKSAQIPLDELRTKPKGKWECEEIQKNNGVSCEAPKPGSKLPGDNTKKLESKNSSVKTTEEQRKDTGFTTAKPDVASITESKPSKWTCDVCLITNDDKRETCEACEAPKPGSEKKNQNKSTKSFSGNLADLSKQSSCATFSFGIKPKTSPSKSTLLDNLTAAASSLEKFSSASNPPHKENSPFENNPASKISFSVVPKASAKWTCDVCLVVNDSDRTHCIACESPHGDLKNTESSNSGKSTFQFGSTSSKLIKFGTPTTKEPAKSLAPDVKTSSTASTNAVTAPTSIVSFRFGVDSASSITTSNTSESKILFGVAKSTCKVGSSDSPIPSVKTASPIQFEPKSLEKNEHKLLSDTYQATVKPSFSIKATTTQNSAVQSTDLTKQSSSTFTFGSKAEKGPLLQQQPVKNPETNELKQTLQDNQLKPSVTSSSSVNNVLFGGAANAVQSTFTHSALFTGFEKQSTQSTSVNGQSPPTFSFGATSSVSKSSLQFGSKSAVTESSSVTPVQSTQPSLFGAKTKTFDQEKKASFTSGTPTFGGFGQQASKSQEQVSKPPAFSGFGQQKEASQNLLSQASEKQSVPSSGTSTFGGFGQQASSAQKETSNNPPVFSGFKQNNPSPNNQSETSTLPIFSGFKQKSDSEKVQAQPAKPVFGGFGKPAVSANQPAANFSFGSTPISATGFSNNTPSLTKAGFSFGGAPAIAPKSQFGNSGFGSSNANTAAPGASQASAGFQFAAAGGSKPQTNVFENSQANSKPAFSFGSAPNAEPKANNGFFNANQASTGSGFNFGSTNTEKNPNPSAGFNFSGSTAPPGFSSAPNAPFQFGSSQMQAKPDSTTNSNFQFNANQSSVPSFGQPSQTQAPAFGQSQRSSSGTNMFSIGQGGRVTPNRSIKQAKRRLKK